jgi:PKD repeat protein
MEPYTIRWDFGDGDSDEEGSADDDNDADHTFDVAGTYTVSATVTDSTGRTVSDSILITVEAPPPLTAVEPEPQPEGTFGGTSPDDDLGPTGDGDDDGGGGGEGTFEDCIVPPGRDPGDVGC